MHYSVASGVWFVNREICCILFLNHSRLFIKEKKEFSTAFYLRSQVNIRNVQERISKDEIEAAAGGDEAAFTRLVEAYQQPIYNLAYRMTRSRAEAEDIEYSP